MPVLVEETTKQRQARLRREYGALFKDAAPVMMMGGTDEQIYDAIERAIAAGSPIVIDWPDGIDA